MNFDSLTRLLSPAQVLAGSAVERAYDCDAYSVDRSAPSCVVLPHSTEQVRQIVDWCLEQGVCFTARGAGTGLSGGAMAAKGGVIVSTKRLDKIFEVDVENQCARVQAGVVNARLSREVRHRGLHFAPDPSSQSVCTIGGNIAENSGGPHTLKQGVTAQHVLQVTLVDSDARIQRFGSRVSGGPGPCLKSLVVGSEGTLGIVTEAWVRLVPLPEHVVTSLVAFQTVRDASESVSQIISSGVIPAALEMMDRNIMLALRAAFGLEFPDLAQALLLIECDGDRVQTEADAATVAHICHEHGALNVRVAASEEERQELWKARKKGIGAMGRLAPTILTHDGVIPPSKLPEMLEFIDTVARDAGVGVANLFHAGDGNLHPCFYFDDRVPGMIERVVEAGESILRQCLKLGGSVTGEHGIGVEKSSVWAESLTQNDLALQHAVRTIFKVSELCNPCKILPDQKGCVEHSRRWRGVAT